MFFCESQVKLVIKSLNYLYRIERYVNKKKTVCRKDKVTKIFLRRVVKIHNGKFYKSFSITKDSLHQKYGALFNTKKLGSKIHEKKKKGKKLLKKKK
jgi:ribosomal protein S19